MGRCLCKPRHGGINGDAQLAELLQLITTDGIPFRKAYIQTVVDRIEVDDHAIRILGDKAALEQARCSNEWPLRAKKRPPEYRL
jgi:hypothetical protein